MAAICTATKKVAFDHQTLYCGCEVSVIVEEPPMSATSDFERGETREGREVAKRLRTDEGFYN